MVGFSSYFHVPANHPVLKHPLYLKYNTLTAEQISALDNFNGIKNLRNELSNIMLTLDNMAIIWYLSNILRVFRDIGEI